jgi:hypothetical protein
MVESSHCKGPNWTSRVILVIAGEKTSCITSVISRSDVHTLPKTVLGKTGWMLAPKSYVIKSCRFALNHGKTWLNTSKMDQNGKWGKPVYIYVYLIYLYLYLYIVINNVRQSDGKTWFNTSNIWPGNVANLTMDQPSQYP